MKRRSRMRPDEIEDREGTKKEEEEEEADDLFAWCLKWNLLIRECDAGGK